MREVWRLYKECFFGVSYIFIMSFLFLGLYQFSGFKHFGKLGLLLFVFCFSYFSFHKLYLGNFFRSFTEKIKIKPIDQKLVIKLFYGITLFGVLLYIFYFFYVQLFPLVNLFHLDNADQMAYLRYDFTHPKSITLAYLSSVYLRAIFPLLPVVFFYLKRPNIAWITLLFSFMISINFLMKSTIIFIVFPTFIYLVLVCKSYVKAIAIMAISLMSIFGISFLAKKLKKDSVIVPKTEHIKKNDSVTIGLLNRVFIVPGEMVSGWFECVPSKEPFLKGKGYRWLKPITGDYEDYTKKLSKYIRPESYERYGFNTVNGAHFVYDYSNFGLLGLIVSGFILAIFLSYLDYLYGINIDQKLIFNLIPFLMLTSSQFTTILLTGGWIFSILIYKVLKYAKL